MDPAQRRVQPSRGLRSWRKLGITALDFIQNVILGVQWLVRMGCNHRMRDIALGDFQLQSVIALNAPRTITPAPGRHKMDLPRLQRLIRRQNRCNHRDEDLQPAWKRYGTPSGSFQRCTECNLRQKWWPESLMWKTWLDGEVRESINVNYNQIVEAERTQYLRNAGNMIKLKTSKIQTKAEKDNPVKEEIDDIVPARPASSSRLARSLTPVRSRQISSPSTARSSMAYQEMVINTPRAPPPPTPSF